MQASKLFLSLLLSAVSAWATAADEPQAAQVATAVGPAADAVKAEAAKPLVALTPYQKRRLARKLVKMELKPFDAPDEAQQYYANKRTGPLITRGPNITTSRPLDPALYQPALAAMRAMPQYSSSTGAVVAPTGGRASMTATAPGSALSGWSSLGPVNQGGRTRALLIDPNSPSIMYAGGVDGGVWKSTDAGATWVTSTDLSMSNLAVVTLAFDPKNSSVIYAGTGEGVGNGDAVRGAGLFRSVDAGVTFTQIASTNTPDFQYTMKVIVSPRNSNRLYVGTRTGVWRSTNGGTSWTNLITNAAGGCTDMAMQEKRTIGFLFASCGRTNVAGAAVYRLLDSDTGAFTSVLALTGQGRSSIAIAPSNEAFVYIVAAQRIASGGPGQYGLHGVYRSTANGNPGSFTTQRQGNVAPGNTATKINQLLLSNPVIALLTECGFGSSQTLNQGWYDNVAAVDPLDPNRLWVGGVDLWRSDDGGVTWGTSGYWWFDKGVDPQYHHADQHGLVFHPGYNGTTNKVLFSTHDGGVDRTDDARASVNTTLVQLCGNPVAGGMTWVDRNNGYVTTQFYNGAVYPDGLTYFGGLQDNGTQRGTGAVSGSWSTIAGGDGGYTAVDTRANANPADDVLFLENTGLSLQRSTNGGANFASATSGITGTGFQFITPFAMNQGNKSQLWIGGFDIWRTTNQATSWTRATGVNQTCGVGSISAFATHPLDGNRVLVGLSDGCYHYNTAALSAPNSGIWPGGGSIVTGYISSMAWDPANTSVAYATVSTFNVNNVFKTTNGGVSWTPSVGTGITALPQIPVHSVVVNPTNSSEVFVGTDLGVFTSIDGGASWYRENTGFANVVVEWLAINETAPHRLFAFTHGRGAWVTNLTSSGAVSTLSGEGGTPAAKDSRKP